jgi:hypothetical protein
MKHCIPLPSSSFFLHHDESSFRSFYASKKRRKKKSEEYRKKIKVHFSSSFSRNKKELHLSCQHPGKQHIYNDKFSTITIIKNAYVLSSLYYSFPKLYSKYNDNNNYF